MCVCVVVVVVMCVGGGEGECCVVYVERGGGVTYSSTSILGHSLTE